MVKNLLKKMFKLEEPAGGTTDVAFTRSVITAHRKPMGSQGTEIYSGFMSEEYLVTLRGEERAKIFDRMRRSDPQIKMLLSAVKNPILSANWEVEAADDTPEAIEDKELIEYILLKNRAKSFKKTLKEALSCVDFGHSVIEKTFCTVADDPKYGIYHGIAGLDHINPKTISRWNVDSESGKLLSVTQVANGDLQRYVDIPSPYLLVFNVDQEGANYEGISWLRPLYGNWFRKNVYLKLNAIGIEKFAVPTPIVTLPDNFANTNKFENLLEALEVYTSGQANYLTIPEGLVMTLEKNSYDPEKVDSAIDAEDRRMAKGFTANFLELGLGGNGGAYALSTDFSDFFLSGIKHIAHDVAEVFNQGLIPELMKLNRGTRAAYPRLIVSGIDDKAGKELAEIVNMLTQSKVIEADTPMEESLRKRYGLTKKSDIGKRVQPEPSAFGGFGGQQSLAERVKRRIYG